jgi:lipoprotein signal peptidase
MRAVVLAGTILASLLFSTAVRWLLEHYLRDPIPILGDWVTLRLLENAGIAFGIDLPLTIFAPLVVVALLLLSIAALRQRGGRVLRASYGLILGGALANLIDRLDDGMVTDFFAIGSFPVFNVADSCITIGVATILLFLTRRPAAKDSSSPLAGGTIPR